MTSTLIARSEARRRFASVWNGASPASRRAGSGGTTTDSPRASTAAPGVASGSPARSCVCVARTLLSACSSFLFLPLQQTFRVFRREPAAVFRDADGDHFIFRFINCIHNGRRRQQRHFMLAAASAKEDANPKLCHTISVWPRAASPSIAGWVPGRPRSQRPPKSRPDQPIV